MNGADAAVALVRGDVTMACAFGGPLDRMETVGKPLMTGAEQEAVGHQHLRHHQRHRELRRRASRPGEEVPRGDRAGERGLQGQPGRGLREGGRRRRHGPRRDQGDDGELRLPDERGAGGAELARRRPAGGGEGRRRGDGGRRATSRSRSTTIRPSSTRASSSDGGRGGACRPASGERSAAEHRHRRRVDGLHAARRRQRACARPDLARHRAGRAGHRARAVGVRQDDAAQHPRRVPRADRRARCGVNGGAGAGAGRRPRHGVPAGRAVRMAVGRRERRLRPADGGAAGSRDPGAGRGSAGAGRARAASPTPRSVSSRAACSSGWRWRAASPTTRGSS